MPISIKYIELSEIYKESAEFIQSEKVRNLDNVLIYQEYVMYNLEREMGEGIFFNYLKHI